VSAANRYSLWLVPDAGAVNDDLQAVIDRLGGEHGGPTFPPHLTLLSGIVAPEDDVVERARRLAAASAPITLHLDDIRADETYFQSLFAVVRPTPELVGLRAAARTVFPEAPDPYRPHVSLLYGHPSAETKQAIMAALAGSLPPSCEARALIVQTGRDVADWRYALRAPLTGSTSREGSSTRPPG
jgi:2'-5' RNA ligase